MRAPGSRKVCEPTASFPHESPWKRLRRVVGPRDGFPVPVKISNQHKTTCPNSILFFPRSDENNTLQGAHNITIGLTQARVVPLRRSLEQWTRLTEAKWEMSSLRNCSSSDHPGRCDLALSISTDQQVQCELRIDGKHIRHSSWSRTRSGIQKGRCGRLPRNKSTGYEWHFLGPQDGGALVRFSARCGR